MPQTSHGRSRYNLRSLKPVTRTPVRKPLAEKMLQITNFLNVRKRHAESKGIVRNGVKRLHFGDIGVDCIKENMSPLFGNKIGFDVITPLGPFAALPVEVVFEFFDHIPLKRLANISTLSKSLSKAVSDYIHSGHGSRRFARDTKNVGAQTVSATQDLNDPFHLWGLVLRATYVCDPTINRSFYLKKFYLKNKDSGNPSGWGRLFRSVCSMWEYFEAHALFRDLISIIDTDLAVKLELVTEGCGKFPDLEMKVRHLLRSFFLDQPFRDEEEASFWTSAVFLLVNGMSRRSKLMMIAFAPLRVEESGREVIDWDSLVENAHMTYEESSLRLSPFAIALSRLHNTQFFMQSSPTLKWADGDIFNMIENVTTTPTPWAYVNFISLFLHRKSLIVGSIRERVRSGLEREAGEMFCSATTMLCRWEKDVSLSLFPTIRILFCALSAAERNSFVGACFAARAALLQDQLQASPFLRSEYVLELMASEAAAPLVSFMVNKV